ncbi:hypothetical protein NW761_013066 [Fusarium oxysporum]|nr:hypothetical protein NW758_012078 [Fusarium oxysporum]KAJ4075804.1 hypothetical protein NW761_013066 [Fusarium oxysporum]
MLNSKSKTLMMNDNNIKDEGMEDGAVVKDEEMEDGCSKRKLGKRLPRTAISISIYVDNNWICV